MQKNISYRKQAEQIHKNTKKQEAKNPRDIVVSRLGYRGMEVLNNAESQFPNETKIVIDKLAELISSGEINEELDGGKLLLLFRSVGLSVRMQTKINVEQDGKFVSLSDKLSNKTISNDE